MYRMYRAHRAKSVLTAAVILLTTVAAAAANGAVIFEDDFADAASAQNWTASGGAPAIAFEDGNAVVNNTSDFWAAYTHVIGGTKPSTFTLTFELASAANDRVGMMFCQQGADSFNGYLLAFVKGGAGAGDSVYAYKLTETSGNVIYTALYSAEVHGLAASNNRFAVSKRGGNFNIFINDEFRGSFTDAAFPSGDIALFAWDGAQAAFNSVRMTNQFTPGRYFFSDDFDGGALHHGWEVMTNPAAAESDVNAANGVLTISNDANVSTWMFVDLPALDQNKFEASVAVRHIGGTEFYGIVLVGDAPQGGGAVPMVSFAIMNESRFAIFSPRDGGGSITTTHHPAIRGGAGLSGVIRIDTLTVRKNAGASTYEFIANGETLSSDYTLVDFPITGIGIFAYSGVTAAFDDFSAGSLEPVSIIFGRDTRPTVRRGSSQSNRNIGNVFYDLRGRRRYAVGTPMRGGGNVNTNNGSIRSRPSAGIYVNEHGGSDVIIRKRR